MCCWRKQHRHKGAFSNTHLHALKIAIYFFYFLNILLKTVLVNIFLNLFFLFWIFVLRSDKKGTGQAREIWLYVVSKGQIPLSHIPLLSHHTKKELRSHLRGWKKEANSSPLKKEVKSSPPKPRMFRERTMTCIYCWVMLPVELIKLWPN